jgi:hypothetical protein
MNQDKIQKKTDQQEAEFHIKIENTDECRLKYIERIKQKIEFGEYPENRINDDVADGIVFLISSPHAIEAMCIGMKKYATLLGEQIKKELKIQGFDSFLELAKSPKNLQYYNEIEKEFYIVRDTVILNMIYYDLIHNKSAPNNLKELNEMNYLYRSIIVLNQKGQIEENLKNLCKVNLIGPTQLRVGIEIVKNIHNNLHNNPYNNP